MKLLKELLSDELYKRVEQELGTEKKYFFGEGDYVPKSRFDEVNTQVNDLKANLTERDTQLADLSKKAKGHEELMSQIEELTAANKQAVEEYEAKLLAREKEYALNDYLTSVGSKNNKALSALLDHETVQFNKGEFLGLKEQVEALKESDPYLFKSDEPSPPGSAGSHIRSPGLGNPAPQTGQQLATKKWNRQNHSF